MKAARYTRASITPAPQPTIPKVTASAPRILLVDDEDAVQKLLTYPLRKEGYDVVPALDGREALDRLSEDNFDLVVLDVMMPKMDGFDVCREIRARSTVPIIMLTAQDRGDRQGPRPRARRRRLHHQALLGARVPQPRQGGPAARRPRPDRGAVRGADRIGRAAHRLREAARRGARRGRASHLRRVRDPRGAGARPGVVFSRTMLLERVWGDAAYRDPRTIDVHIRHLREKLDPSRRRPS